MQGKKTNKRLRSGLESSRISRQSFKDNHNINFHFCIFNPYEKSEPWIKHSTLTKNRDILKKAFTKKSGNT